MNPPATTATFTPIAKPALVAAKQTHCDYCDEESDALKRRDPEEPFPPMLCPECYAIVQDGPQT